MNTITTHFDGHATFDIDVLQVSFTNKLGLFKGVKQLNRNHKCLLWVSGTIVLSPEIPLNLDVILVVVL